MDALFGLCRKKSAGISVRSPLQEGVFFERQPDVDKFVELYPYRSDSSADQVYIYIVNVVMKRMFFSSYVLVGM